MIALGSNAHIFARPYRREELAECFKTVLGSPVRTVDFPGINQSMLVVSFPDGGHLKISKSPGRQPGRLKNKLRASAVSES